MSDRAVQRLRHYLRQVCGDAVPREDAYLLRQFIEANDHRSFEILLDRHGPMVLGTARRLVNNSADADDVFQAVFLSLARLAKTIRQGKTVPNWLYTTTCRIAARARKRRAVSIETVPEPSAASELETDLAWREVRAALDEELQRLPERLRSPLLLCYLSGLTRDEAAEQLGWSLGTLKRRLEEGRAALRARLERRGISAAGLALAVLSPSALNAAVCPSLAKTCLTALSGTGSAGVSALILTTTTFKGIAMKAAIVSLALVGLGAGIYSSFGRADPPKPVEAKKSEEPKAAAKKLESFDDPLPPGSTMRLGTSRFRQGVAIVAMTVSADGKTAFVVTGTRSDGSTRAFDLATGLPLFTLKNDEGEAIALSPDGQTFVTKQYPKLHIFDSKTGQHLRAIDIPKANPRSGAEALAITPDGKAIATISDGKAVHLIDFESGKLIRDFPHEGWGALAIAFSPDGKLMAAGGFDSEKDNYFARLWEVETGKELRRFMHGRSYGIPCLAFSPDGKTLATIAHDGRLQLFDVETGKQRKVIPKDGPRRDHGVAFTPDGKTVAAAGIAIHLYDTTTGEERLRIDRTASHLHFRDKGKTLTGVVDGAIYRWDAVTGKSLTPESAGDGSVVQILVGSNGTRIITRSYQGDFHIWDGVNGKLLRFIKSSWGAAMTLSPDGRYLAWVVDRDSVNIRLYDLAADRIVERFPTFKGGARVLAFTADGKTLVTIDHQDGTVRSWNVEVGKEQRSFQAVPDALKKQPNVFRSALASPDGKTLAVVCDERQEKIERLGHHAVPPDTIRLWDIGSGKQLRQLEGNSSSMAFSPNGRLLVTSGAIWDVATGKRVGESAELSPTIAFSNDGRLLATAWYDGTIRVLETATWTERTRFKCAHERTTSLAYTPAGQLLCGGLDTTVLAYDVRLRPGDASGILETAWNDLTNRDAGRAFKSQGRLLATPSQAVKLFAEKIKAVDAVDANRVRKLIADLDNDTFAVREAASKALSELGPQIRPALEKAVKSSTSQDLADRAKKIFGEWEAITPEQLRQMRAVEVLELIASDEAKNLLKHWAAGVKGAMLTEEAGAALAWLERGVANARSAR